MDIRAIERNDCTEYYLTAAAAADDLASARVAYAEAAAFLAERRAAPVIEKSYGRIAWRNQIAAVRAAAFQERGLPVDAPFGWLEGAPVGGGGFAGLQIWAIAPKPDGAARVTNRPLGGGVVGRQVDRDGFRLLYVPGIRGVGAAAPEQAATMFERARNLAAAGGFAFRDVRRTWIYLARLLDWYDEFNRVRTAFFRREGVGFGTPAEFPASTGIQGRAGDEECVMDFMAMTTTPNSPVVIETMSSSPRQSSSFEYGSAFSRALAVREAGVATVFVSGTASIDRCGATAHVGDPAAQTRETLACVAALLEAQGGGLENIVQATCFVKNAAADAACRRVRQSPGAPQFPMVTVLADICREALLVEIEAVAVI